ncbi:MAG: hypothetical protein JWO72_68 [Caulobacteraceae bacterium]|nr:hypothetical protein [Caulobacteraceae bacterium]
MKSGFTGPRRRARVTAAVVVGLSWVGGHAWAQTANYPAGGPKPPSWSSLPAWNGMWERDGDIVWDDRIAPDQPQTPPYNAEYQKRAAGIPNRGPVGPGMPNMMTMIFPMEVEINQREMLIVGESSAPRRIYIDGRLHPEDPLPSSTGHSIGQWKGKELLVDTCCIKDSTPLPGGGPHSDALHIKERIWAPDANTLLDEITVEDPKAFLKPWTTVKTFRRRPDWEPVEYDRQENDRDTPAGRGRGGPRAGGAEAPAAPPAPAPVASAAPPAAPVPPVAPTASASASPAPARSRPLGKPADVVALQKATVRAVGAMAWESVKISNVQRDPTTVKWVAATRSAQLHCTAAADGDDSVCER